MERSNEKEGQMYNQNNIGNIEMFTIANDNRKATEIYHQMINFKKKNENIRDSPCIHQQRDCGKEGSLIQQNDVHVYL